jgi:hypothetical protein
MPKNEDEVGSIDDGMIPKDADFKMLILVATSQKDAAINLVSIRACRFAKFEEQIVTAKRLRTYLTMDLR